MLRKSRKVSCPYGKSHRRKAQELEKINGKPKDAGLPKTLSSSLSSSSGLPFKIPFSAGLAWIFQS